MAPAFTSLADVGKMPDAPDPGVAKRKKVGRSPSVTSLGGDKNRESIYDQAGSVGLRSRKSITNSLEAKKKMKGPSLIFQAMRTPGKMRLRELDPRRVAFQESASTRVVLDWRKNRWEGTFRLIDRLLPNPKTVQYTMKMTGAARASKVPDDESLPSSEEEGDESSENDEVENSDSEQTPLSSSNPGSATHSTATGSHLDRQLYRRYVQRDVWHIKAPE